MKLDKDDKGAAGKKSEPMLGRDDRKDTFADILLFGPSGAGKTTLASTAPRPLYVASPDPTGHKAIPYKTPGEIIASIEEMRDVYAKFTKGGYQREFNTLLIDGLPFLYELFEYEMGIEFKEKKGSTDKDMLPIGAYGKIMKQFRELLRAFVGLTMPKDEDRMDGIHVIFTALSERIESKEDTGMLIRPRIGSDKMNQRFPSLFSITGYVYPLGSKSAAEKDPGPGTDRGLLVTPWKGVEAKDRLGLLPLSGPVPKLSDYLFDKFK